MKEKNSMKDRKKLVFSTVCVAVLMVGALSGIFVATNNDITQPIISLKDDDVKVEKKPAEWHLAPMVGANNSPAASGIVNVFTLENGHASLDYDTAILESDAYVYEHGDADGFSDGEELAGNTPFDTGFDICVVYQFTGAQAVDGGAWNISRVKAYCNSTDLGISSQLMEKSSAFYQTTGTGDSDTGLVNFYLKDADGGAGTGFTLGVDETFTVDDNKVYHFG